MNKTEVFEKIKTILVKQFSIDDSKITKECSYSTDLGLDSLDIVDYFMELQQELDLSIPDEELNDIFTVQKTIDKVHDLMSVKQ